MDLPMRTALVGDASVLRDVVRAAYAKWVPVLGREPLPMQADYDAAVQVHRFDVIEADGRIVALIETEVREGHYWIENVAVLPEMQGHGLGRRLLAHAETLARAAGLSEIRLLTNGKMVANRQLYVALGYIEDREEPYKGGSGVHLSKRLG